MGKTSAELMKMMESNQLLAEEFLPKFAVALRASVREGDALGKMMKGTSAQMGRFGNSVNDAMMAFSKGGFNKAFLEFLRDATSAMNTLIKNGFFDALGFGFRMLMMPIRAVLEVVESLSKIFKKASDEGGEYRNNLILIASVMTLLLLPALLAVGRALTPLLLTVAGLIAIGDILSGLAGDSSEFADNWDKLTTSIKNGKTDWDALKSVLAQIGISLAGIVGSVLMLRKLKGIGKGAAATVGETAKKAGGGVVSKSIGVLASAAKVGSTAIFGALQSDKLGDSTLPLMMRGASYSTQSTSGGMSQGHFERVQEAKARFEQSQTLRDNIRSLEGKDNLTPFEARQMNEYNNSRGSVVTIGRIDINGESAGEFITDMEGYVNNVFNDIFKDTMRDSVR